jgi:hypothetical protein
MAPRRTSWASCGLAVMRPRARTGRSARIPRWCVRTSTRPVRAVCCPLTWSRGHRRMTRICWPGDESGGSGPLPRRPDHEDSPGRRPALPAGHPDPQSRPAWRLPAIHPLMESIRIRRRGKGRPGAALGDKAYSSAANCAYLRCRGIQAVIPVKEDQKAHRRNRGSAGGRPRCPRPRTVQGTQHGRALLQPAQAVPRRRHPL